MRGRPSCLARINRLPVNLGAELIDNDDRKCGIHEPRIAPEQPREFPAMLNGTYRVGKLNPLLVPGRNAVLHIEIIGSHRDRRDGHN